VEVDYLFHVTGWSNTVETNFNNSFKNNDTFAWQLGLDSSNIGGFYTGTGGAGIKFSIGLTPYSKGKNEYRKNQELKIGFIATGSNPINSSARSHSKSFRLDTITTLTISNLNNDTIVSQRFKDSTSYFNESLSYSASQMSLFLEWEFKTKEKKRVRLSIAPAIKFTYLYQAVLNYSYKQTGYIDNELSSNPFQSNSYIRTAYKAKNGFGITPYANLSLDIKMSKKDNLLSAMHFVTYSALGLNIIKINGTQDFQTQNLFNFGVGVKYKL